MLQSNTFWRTVVCGFIATFVMTMIAFVQTGIGLPLIDVGYFLQETFNHIHEAEPYTIIWGNTAYYVVGILLALIWVLFLQNRIPGDWLVQGILYGVIISVVAAVIVSPLVSLAGGEPFGLFYSNTWFPFLFLIGGLVMHLGYGIVLTLGLKYAGVRGLSSSQE